MKQEFSEIASGKVGSNKLINAFGTLINEVVGPVIDLVSAFNGASQDKLKNGLGLKCIQKPGDAYTRVMLTINTGSASDPAGKEGAAHFTEHMVFSRNEDIIELFEELVKRGGYGNASTYQYKTEYTFEIPSSRQNDAFLMNLINRSVFDMDIDVEQMEREKEVIADVESWFNGERNNSKNPAMLPLTMIKQAYGIDNPVERPQSMLNSLRSLTDRDLTEFHIEYYTAQNANVMIMGPQSENFYRRIAQNNLSGVYSGDNKPEETQDAPEYISGEYHIDNSNTELVHAGVGFKLPAFKDIDHKARLTERVMEEYIRAQLGNNLRGKDRRTTYSPRCYNMDLGDARMLCVFFESKPYASDLLLPQIAEIMQDMAMGKIDKELLAGCKAKIAASITENLNSMQVQRSDYNSTRDGFRYDRAELKHVTETDLSDMVNNIVLAELPTYTTIGDASNMQSYEKVQELFKPVPEETRVKPEPSLWQKIKHTTGL